MGDPHIHTLDGSEFDLYDKGTYSVFHYGGAMQKAGDASILVVG